MMHAAAGVQAAKWVTPAAAAGVVYLLALDGTQISVAVIAAAQAAIVAWFGYRQVVGQRRAEAAQARLKREQESRSEDLQHETDVNTVRIDGAHRLIDQLQELGITDRALIATLQLEISNLNTRIIELQGQLLSVTTGAMRLAAQLQQHDIDPVWTPGPPPTKENKPDE